MNIAKLTIKKFRGIESIVDLDLKALTILLGENGTSKTSVIEAINFCLSPSFLSDRIVHTDFYLGGDNIIEVEIHFDKTFEAYLPDGFTKQTIDCIGVYLGIKKRDRAKSGKTFADLVVTNHHLIPSFPKNNQKGWSIKRKSGSNFNFDERLLSFPVQTSGLPKPFYFGRGRDKQLKKGFKTSFNSLIDDFNWRYSKHNRKATPPSTIPQELDTVEKYAYEQPRLVQMK